MTLTPWVTSLTSLLVRTPLVESSMKISEAVNEPIQQVQPPPEQSAPVTPSGTSKEITAQAETEHGGDLQASAQTSPHKQLADDKPKNDPKGTTDGDEVVITVERFENEYTYNELFNQLYKRTDKNRSKGDELTNVLKRSHDVSI